MTEYKATPEQWANIEGRVCDELSCYLSILELRARVEALEVTQQDKLDRLIAQDRDDAPVAAGSLVERVSCAIDGRINPDQWLHQDAARAAIREVAAWLEDENTDIGMGTARNIAERLRNEAER